MQVYYNGKLYKKLDPTLMMILCSIGLVGFAGLHHFYRGKVAKGILYFFTMGLFLFGTIYDLVTMNRKISAHNMMVEEIIKRKELEEAKRQSQLRLYEKVGQGDVKTKIRGTLDL